LAQALHNNSQNPEHSPGVVRCPRCDLSCSGRTSVDRSVVRYFSSQKAEVRNCRPHKGSRSHRALHAEKRRFCKGRMHVCTARGRRSARIGSSGARFGEWYFTNILHANVESWVTHSEVGALHKGSFDNNTISNVHERDGRRDSSVQFQIIQDFQPISSRSSEV
jgi:hypothetical protein